LRFPGRLAAGFAFAFVNFARERSSPAWALLEAVRRRAALAAGFAFALDAAFFPDFAGLPFV
jgi:hypothetical protein